MLVQGQAGVFALGAAVVMSSTLGPLCTCIGLSLLSYYCIFVRKKSDVGEEEEGGAHTQKSPLPNVDEDSSDLSDH